MVVQDRWNDKTHWAVRPTELMRGNMNHLHCHSKSAFFGIVAGQRHPGDVEGMREGSERLSPNNSKVSHTTKAKLCKDTVEDVTEEMHAETSYDGFTTFVTAFCYHTLLVGSKAV